MGDRIAIMSQGKLKCSGTPLYLKSKYGSGYTLTLTKKRNTPEITNASTLENNQQEHQILESVNPGDSDSSGRLISLIRNIVPNAKLNSNINSEISFTLPTNEAHKFSDMFNSLEKEKDNLNILNIGISITTLEDVFLRIGEYENFSDEEEGENRSLQNNANYSQEIDEEFKNYGLWIGSKKEHRIGGILLVLQQFRASFTKRFIHSIRNKALIISQLVIPIACLLINLIYLKYAPIKAEDSPPLAMNLSRYGQNYVPYTVYSEGYETSSLYPIAELSEIFHSKVNLNQNSRAFQLESRDIMKLCIESRDSIDHYLGCMGRLDMRNVIDSHVIGIDFNSFKNKTIKLVGHFNNQPFHVPSLTLNFITNSLYNLHTNSTNRTIKTINHPLPRILDDQLKDFQLKDRTGFNVATGLTFGLVKCLIFYLNGFFNIFLVGFARFLLN